MLPFEFERGLFKFTLNTPALAPLFQLPPAIGKRNSLFPKIKMRHFLPSLFADAETFCIQLPVIFPICVR